MENKTHNLKNLEVNEETLKIDEIHRDFVSNMDDELGECCESRIDAIEHTSRDGFIPHSFNQGGYAAHIMMGIWSGGYNSAIQTQIDKTLEYVEELGREEFGESYDPCNNNDHGNWEAETLSECGDYFYIEARAMFHGLDEDGNYSTTFELIARVSDAPYFRYADSIAEFTLEYKDSKELEQKLEENFVSKKLLAHISNGDDENLELAA